MVPASLTDLVGTRRLPAGFADRAREFQAGLVEPVTPRHAATVVLVRDVAGGTEVYALRRRSTMAFASGMYVFPGGSVDPRDAEADIGWVGPDPAWWASRFDASEELARALVCAAVRETFEESGVLLAGPDADAVVADTSGADWEADRVALVAGDLGLAAFLHRRGLAVRADLLRAWTHWITPAVEPRRFDTRFLVAAMPPGQRTRAFGEEADQVEWIDPRAAVRRWRDGTLAMMPPTLITMAEVAEHPSAAAVLTAAADRTVRPIEPQVVVRGEHADLVLPGDPGYPT